MKKIIFAIATLALILGSCRSNSAVSSQEVKFKNADGYFFRNDRTVPDKPLVMTSKEQLEDNFGYAATMAFHPTEIDFANFAAIGIVVPPANQETDIVVKSVTKQSDNTLLVTYKVKKGSKLSYTIQPLKIVTIPKSLLLPNVISKEE